MLSDILIPMLDLTAPTDPIDAYQAALQLLETTAGDAKVVIPGHGSVGGLNQARTRIDQDRAYLHAVRNNQPPDDPRLTPTAYGKDWLPAVHDRQLQQLAQRTEPASPS
jgi:glyoxylase-like metal-dependent hydrolase (beta-lactamase superfamily II)